MLPNFFKITWRNLTNNKLFSFINIFGLSVGLATCLLIMLYIFDELSYDQHHTEGDPICRVITSVNDRLWAGTPAPIAQGIKEDFPEVAQVTRLLKIPGVEQMLLRHQEGKENTFFYEKNIYYTDSTFLDIFQYDFKYGTPAVALQAPNSLILSEQVATKLFGDINPLEKTVKIEHPYGKIDYQVKGVFRDNQQKSHIDGKVFLSLHGTGVGRFFTRNTNWATNNIFYTYAKLNPTANQENFNQKLDPFFQRRAGEDLKAMGFGKTLLMQPIEDIYLNANVENELGASGNWQFLYILGAIAVFLLFMACINFMNLSTAKSEKRAREVGVRKVLGVEKSALITQFLGESLIMTGIALVIALQLITIALPSFNVFTGKELTLFQHLDLVYWVAGLAIITGLLAGIYPAFYLSSFQPITVLKGRFSNSIAAANVRKGLVIFQFVTSICLILGAAIIWQQLDYVKGQSLGFQQEQQLIIPMESQDAMDNYTVLKESLLKKPTIQKVTAGSTYPGIENIEELLFYAAGKTMDESFDVSLAAVEDDYIETLGFDLLHGRTFSKEFKADDNSIILNEVAIRELGYEPDEAVGKSIFYEFQGNKSELQIVGVVKDFNFQSLHQNIKAFGMTTSLGTKRRYLIANVSTDDYTQLLKEVEEEWATVNAGMPFIYSFLDQDFAKNYAKDQLTAQIIINFTLIAIFIACLGLFGLISYTAEQRTKEIGIRKVLGASTENIVGLLSKDFLKLVLIAFLIAAPLSWFLMDSWLNNFAYRVGLQVWVFIAGGLLTAIFAFLTISTQSIRAALVNPVKAIKSE